MLVFFLTNRLLTAIIKIQGKPGCEFASHSVDGCPKMIKRNKPHYSGERGGLFLFIVVGRNRPTTIVQSERLALIEQEAQST